MILSSAILLAPLFAQADTLTRYLSVGMSGSDVSALQSFLAQDTTIYPQGLVTGYFGFLTKAAVSNFQVRNGIVSAGGVGAGRVGPATLPVLNLQMAQGMTNATVAPIITSVSTSVGRNTANVSWNTNENARGVVYYSTSSMLPLGEHANSVDVSGATAMTDSGYHTMQNVALANLLPNTTYYYLVYTTDQTGNVSITWPAMFQTTN